MAWPQDRRVSGRRRLTHEDLGILVSRGGDRATERVEIRARGAQGRGGGLIGLSQNLHVPIPMALFQRGANWTVDSKHWARLECEEIRTRGLSGLVDEPDAPHRW